MTAEPLLLIAGPCVIEGRRSTLDIARRLADIAGELSVPLVFKASFDKANRTSVYSYRGPGLESGLDTLAKVTEETGLPVTTDVHEPWQCEAVARVCEVVQIPAFLARQTNLICEAACAVLRRPVVVAMQPAFRAS